MSFGGTFSQFLALVDTANIIHQNAFVKYFDKKDSKIYYMDVANCTMSLIVIVLNRGKKFDYFLILRLRLMLC